MPKSRNIYMDYAAGAEPNPSSVHPLGVKAKTELQNARKKVADILRARPSEIIFTSGGTEANNLAVQGTVLAWREKISGNKIPHIITTSIEHPSVLETFQLLKKRKLAEISVVPVEKNGVVDPKKIKKEIKNNTALISVMYANNEIGTIQPIREIAKEIRHYKKGFKRSDLKSSKRSDLDMFPVFHTDAVQAANYLDLNTEKLGVDLLSLSGSKIEGSGRVGMLYKKKSVSLVPVFGGGGQETDLRPGTENLPGILKFSNALNFSQKIKQKEIKRLTGLRDYFIKKCFQVLDTSTGVQHLIMNGDLKERLPNNINITFSKIPSDLLVIELGAYGIMASSKSACESSRKEGSYVIRAIREESDSEIGGVRFSLGGKTTKKDIDYTVEALSRILAKLGKWYGYSTK